MSDGKQMQADLLAELEQQLAAANVKVQQLERYVDGNDLRSDYQTAGHMRQALEHANARVEELELLVQELVNTGTETDTALGEAIRRAERAESTLAACGEALKRVQAGFPSRSMDGGWGGSGDPAHADQVNKAIEAAEAAMGGGGR
jgi:DNA repair exonuclease SbcCD ATPase subunit